MVVVLVVVLLSCVSDWGSVSCLSSDVFRFFLSLSCLNDDKFKSSSLFEFWYCVSITWHKGNSQLEFVGAAVIGEQMQQEGGRTSGGDRTWKLNICVDMY
jgi:hypothetical protein